MKKTSNWLIAFALFWAGCSGSQLTTGNLDVISGSSLSEAEANYIIKLGDQLRIRIQEYPEFDTTAVVGPSGTVSLRLIGELPAIGLTKAQFTKDLRSKLSLYIRNEVTLTITIPNREGLNVTVLGQVVRQGNYAPPPSGSLLEILATAGGPISDSDLRHVKVFRARDYSNPIEVDLTLTLTKQKSGEILPTVEGGDTVFIPKEENFITQLGSYLRDSFFLFGLLGFFK